MKERATKIREGLVSLTFGAPKQWLNTQQLFKVAPPPLYLPHVYLTSFDYIMNVTRPSLFITALTHTEMSLIHALHSLYNEDIVYAIQLYLSLVLRLFILTKKRKKQKI